MNSNRDWEFVPIGQKRYSMNNESPEKTIARLTERVFLLEAILAQVTIEVEKIIQVMDKGKSNDTIQNK